MKIPNLAVFFITFALAQSLTCSAAEHSETEDSEIPINETATAEAWTAFRAGQSAIALAKANQVIERYQPAADKIQTILEERKADLPVGDVSAAAREQINRYQILHDVASCLLIKAWVAEQQGRKEEAVTAYTKIKNYSYARVAEHANEPVWSAAELAAQQLGRLSQ